MNVRDRYNDTLNPCTNGDCENLPFHTNRAIGWIITMAPGCSYHHTHWSGWNPPNQQEKGKLKEAICEENQIMAFLLFFKMPGK